MEDLLSSYSNKRGLKAFGNALHTFQEDALPPPPFIKMKNLEFCDKADGNRSIWFQPECERERLFPICYSPAN
ncbi:hypothetical protein HNY73_005111 [Argiope bruennichi]|uniref:Uncharacterized protein n=1 Tax=Argiope bruennichi TaxID=94029 RepID=A0A8T0FML3_ARGBR|nr:hypothetical protein HNY73_005111 [Argiope bruennichi]